MRLAAITVAGSLLAVSGAFAQTSGNVSTTTSTQSMAELIASGFEIKAAVPNGSKIIVFLQKDKSAFACEFVNVASSRCGAIN